MTSESAPAGADFPVTGEEVLEAMMRMRITRVDLSACRVCGVMRKFVRIGDRAYQNAACGCTDDGWRLARTWDDAARLIELRPPGPAREEMMRRFGIDPGNRTRLNAPGPETD